MTHKATRLGEGCLKAFLNLSIAWPTVNSSQLRFLVMFIDDTLPAYLPIYLIKCSNDYHQLVRSSLNRSECGDSNWSWSWETIFISNVNLSRFRWCVRIPLNFFHHFWVFSFKITLNFGEHVLPLLHYCKFQQLRFQRTDPVVTIVRADLFVRVPVHVRLGNDIFVLL